MFIASLYNVYLLQFFADSLCVVFKVILYKKFKPLVPNRIHNFPYFCFIENKIIHNHSIVVTLKMKTVAGITPQNLFLIERYFAI